jgi:hypothetical protein
VRIRKLKGYISGVGRRKTKRHQLRGYGDSERPAEREQSGDALATTGRIVRAKRNHLGLP